MKRIVGGLIVTGLSLAAWLGLVAASCPGPCPFCK